MQADRLTRWADGLVRIGARDDPELRFRAELGVAFGLLQVGGLLLSGALEWIWGTPTIALVFLLALLPMLGVVLWLRRGGHPSSANLALLTILYLTAGAINVGSGGQAIGANVALPTLALFAVLLSSTRMALLWILLIVLQIVVVAALRSTELVFPIRPDAGWVAGAIDRVPVVLSLTSALIGWLIRRALLRYRADLERARRAEQEARSVQAAVSAQFEEFAHIAADGFWETDAELKLNYVSPSFARMMGLQASDFLGLTPKQAYRARFPDAEISDDYMRPMLQREAYVDQLLRSRDPQGRPLWLRSQGRPRFDVDGTFLGYRGAVHDITDEHLARQAQLRSEQRLQLITDNLPVLIAYIDTEQVFRFNNQTYAQWLDRPLAEITGKPLAEVYDAETWALIQPQLERALRGERVEFAIPPGGTRQRFVQVTYVPDVDAHGRVRGVYGLIHDVTEMRRAEAELRHLSEFDSLTGLANRKRLGDKVGEAIARSERNGQPMALLFLDLDHFKAINDRLGHKGGDLVLQEFARRLQACVRQTDTVARLAGDEFVIVLEMLHGAEQAQRVADKVVDQLGAAFAILGQTLQVSASIGIAVRAPGELDGEALLRRADHAMYAAKAAGRGGSRWAEEALHRESPLR